MRLAYYGDDFTGSTDALEALTARGFRAVLFTEPPTAAALARFSTLDAVGIAGNSRAMTPAAMTAALPTAFESLRALGPTIVHYKVCSTFDSSPQLGSIGRAIEIGRRVFDNQLTPLVVGAPNLQRYCLFGNLFARSGLDSPVYRLDRHPTMSRHPVTPMAEADLRRHLAAQTDLAIELVDVLTIERGPAAILAALAAFAGSAVVLFDTLTPAHLEAIGAALVDYQQQLRRPLFVAGSSAIESALTVHWQTTGGQPSEFKGFAPPRGVNQIVAVSGSCSPVTSRQIDWALANQFAEIPLDISSSATAADIESLVEQLAARAGAELDRGRSVLMHTIRGPDDPRLARSKVSHTGGLNAAALGDILGRILSRLLSGRRIDRVAIAGGDTSGEVARSIGIEALEMVGPLAPGAPLCAAYSSRREVEGVEFVFKGGQVGHDDFFGSVLRGGPTRSIGV